MSTVMKVTLRTPLMGGLPGSTLEYSFEHIVNDTDDANELGKQDARIAAAYSAGYDEGVEEGRQT